jgi:hypothetical protein
MEILNLFTHKHKLLSLLTPSMERQETHAFLSESLGTLLTAHRERGTAIGAIWTCQSKILALSQNGRLRIEPDFRHLGLLVFFLTVLVHPGFSPPIYKLLFY